MGEEADRVGAIGVLAKRLEHLFNTVYPKGRGPYSNKEAADLINTRAGEQIISPNYIWQLRKGERAEPSFNRLAAIAKLFGVKVTYFSDDEVAERTDDQLAIVDTLRELGVEHIATRATGLSPESMKAIAEQMTAVLAQVEYRRQVEGVQDDDEPTA